MHYAIYAMLVQYYDTSFQFFVISIILVMDFLPLHSCWLPKDKGLYWSFVVPVILSVLVSWSTFTVSSYICACTYIMLCGLLLYVSEVLAV